GVFLVESILSLSDLKNLLRTIENKIGRVRRKNKSGPRSIDLDVIVWNGNIIDNDVYERDFLRNSLIEIMPELEKIF
ncbi:MAG: 2-amino-4-hydroxy-6-hydroxymethyldihydropteridine diphosphokinase, partial [Thermodesulfobacteriota bacterium]